MKCKSTIFTQEDLDKFNVVREASGEDGIDASMLYALVEDFNERKDKVPVVMGSSSLAEASEKQSLGEVIELEVQGANLIATIELPGELFAEIFIKEVKSGKPRLHSLRAFSNLGFRVEDSND